MKIKNWVKNIPAVLLAAGIWVGSAYAGNIYVGDPGFEENDVNDSTYTDYAYIASGHVSAWEDIDSITAGEFGPWWYNSNYDNTRRTTPRNGAQALHGSADYAWQTLDATFETGKEYTLSAYLGGDTDSTATSDVSWLYIYHADTTPDLSTVFFDNDSLTGSSYNRDGTTAPAAGAGLATNEGWTTALDSWGLVTLSYTATAADDGRPIGIGLYGRSDATIDDVEFNVIPEPSAVILCGLGVAGLTGLRRRKQE
jgi:hypothetical protein